MVLTYKDLQDRVMRLLDETSSSSPTTLTLIKDLLNQSHQRRCAEFPWNFLIWPRAMTFSTAVGRQIYSLHEEFHRPLYFLNQTTKEYMVEIPNREVVDQSPDWNADPTSTSVRHFMYWGMQPIQNQPSSTAQVVVVSSATTDTGSKTVTIEGELSTGVLTSESLAMNGTTNVTSTNTYREIIGVTKNTSFNGTMTMSISGASVLSLAPTQMGKQYKTIFLPEEITEAETIEYRFYRQPRIMTNDYDIPLIPAPHSQILVYDTLVSLSAYLTDSGPQTLQIWKEKAAQEQMALYQAYANEGQTLNASPKFVRWMGDDFEFPKIYT